MPGRFNRLHAHPAKFHACAICKWCELVLRLRLRAQINLCAKLIAQLQMSGDKVRVQVRQKNVFDMEFVFCGKREIDADVALWVDHGCLACLLIANQIRSMSQAAQIKLFEDQSRNPRSGICQWGSLNFLYRDTTSQKFKLPARPESTLVASRLGDTASAS